jgi:hypothetical protein
VNVSLNRGSIFARPSAASVIAALFLAACAPLPQQDSTAANATAASAPQVVQAAPVKPAQPPAPPGQQTLVVGTANGYHRTIKATAPSQVCDNDAFADGVRYGYALTWNRMIGEAAASGGKTSKRKFDAAALHSQDDQYKIEWNGKERVNACASDGYLIGRIVGTHLASEDLRPGKSS